MHAPALPSIATIGAIARWLGIALCVAIVALLLATALDLRGNSAPVPGAGTAGVSAHDAGPNGSTPSGGPVGQTAQGGPTGSTAPGGPQGATGPAGP
jgi:hypothetical protein